VILVDTSVWVDHLRSGNAELRALLGNDEAASHPFVIGELACGTLRKRHEVLRLLGRLPMLAVAEHAEVLSFIDSRRLMGRGLGWVDVHLLASAALASVRLFTLDRRLAARAVALGVA
jgi:predicted nucleic acid-binding protein